MDAYTRYGPALVRKAERMLGNAADAEDVVHELFVELLSRTGVSTDLPYLYRAVTNRCLNLIRDRTNRERLLARQQPALRGVVRTRCDDVVISLDLLAQLVARLDRNCQEVLVLHFMDDMPQEEIAALLNTSRKTVGKRLARIRTEVLRLSEAGEEARP
jgi:RNA polymerase sigma factor (sigma-70 family)